MAIPAEVFFRRQMLHLPVLCRISFRAVTSVMVAHEVDVCPCPHYAQLGPPLPDPELLASNAAPVDIQTYVFRVWAGVPVVEARSLAPASHSRIFITPSKSHGS